MARWTAAQLAAHKAKKSAPGIGSVPKKAKATGETANRITANVIRIINMTPNCVAYRINNVGVWDAAKKIHRRGNTEKGLADIWACIRGRFLTIEVKAGKDKLSVDQEKRIFEIERAGGYTIVAHSTADFETAFKEFL